MSERFLNQGEMVSITVDIHHLRPHVGPDLRGCVISSEKEGNDRDYRDARISFQIYATLKGKSRDNAKTLTCQRRSVRSIGNTHAICRREIRAG